MTAKRVRRVLRVVALAVLSALLLLAIRTINWPHLTQSLHEARPLWLLAAAMGFLAILPLWAAEWTILAPASTDRSFRRMLGVVALTSSALNTTAFLIGEATGVALLVARAGVSRPAAVSVLAMDQLLVGIAKLAVLGAAALALPLPDWMRGGIASLSVAVALLLALSLASAWRFESLAPRTAHLLDGKVARAIARAGEALAPLRSPKRASAAIVLALAKKAVEVAAIVCVQRAFGLDVQLGAAILVLGALNLSTLVPLVPGNLGVYEGTVTLIYTSLGVPVDRALAIAVVQHACYFAALALPGYVVLAFSTVEHREAAVS